MAQPNLTRATIRVVTIVVVAVIALAAFEGPVVEVHVSALRRKIDQPFG